MNDPIEHNLDYIFDPDDFSEVVWCTRCGALGSELLTWCPGEEISEDTRKACAEDGNVRDLERWRRKKGKPPSLIFEAADDVEGWE